MTNEKDQRLTTLQLVAYGAPAMPLSIVGLPLVAFVPAIYGDSAGLGLSLGLVGLMLTLSRLSDVVTDPLIGFFSDRVRTRWGRRKPFVVVGAPLFAIGIWMVFVPPQSLADSPTLGLVYLLLALSLVYLGSTIKELPYFAWGAELSMNYHERTRITSGREIWGVIGSLVSAFTPAIILFFGYTEPAEAAYVLAVFLIVLLPIAVAFAVGVVPEYPVNMPARKIPLKESMGIVLHNRPYVRLVTIFALSSLGSAMTVSLGFFFLKHVVFAADLYGIYIAGYFLSNMAAIPVWFWISRRLGKHRTMMAAAWWFAIWASLIPLIAIAPYRFFEAFEVSRIFAFLPEGMYQTLINSFGEAPSGKFVFFLATMCLKGTAGGAFSIIAPSMAADIVDLDSTQTQQKRAGAYFSIWSMVRKMAFALGITIGTSMVVAAGFDSLADPLNTTNSAFSLLMLTLCYALVPALLQLSAVPLLWNYELTEDKVEEVQSRIPSLGGDLSKA